MGICAARPVRLNRTPDGMQRNRWQCLGDLGGLGGDASQGAAQKSSVNFNCPRGFSSPTKSLQFIRFSRADILRLGSLGCSFDISYCTLCFCQTNPPQSVSRAQSATAKRGCRLLQFRTRARMGQKPSSIEGRSDHSSMGDLDPVGPIRKYCADTLNCGLWEIPIGAIDGRISCDALNHHGRR